MKEIKVRIKRLIENLKKTMLKQKHANEKSEPYAMLTFGTVRTIKR